MELQSGTSKTVASTLWADNLASRGLVLARSGDSRSQLSCHCNHESTKESWNSGMVSSETAWSQYWTCPFSYYSLEASQSLKITECQEQRGEGRANPNGCIVCFLLSLKVNFSLCTWCACACVCTVYMLWKPERCQIPGTGGLWCWEWSSTPLERHPVLVTTEPLLQSVFAFFGKKFFI